MEIVLTPINATNEVELIGIERTENGDRVLTDKEFASLIFKRKGYFDAQISYNEKENKIKIVILNF